MVTGEFIGRRVKVVHWPYRDSITAYLERKGLGVEPEGTITHVVGSDGSPDIWVRVDGLEREYAFGLEQLRVQP